MTRPSLALAAAILALALVACSPAAKTPASVPAGSPAASAPAPGAGLEAQAAWLKGAPAKLTRIAGSAAWLGSPSLEAYRDADGAECVYDRETKAVLSWDPTARTVADASDGWKPEGYAVTVGAAAAKADVKAAELHKGGIGAMRRTVQLDDKGDGPLYVFQYDSYVDGVRVPDHVTVDCSGATGEPGFTAFYAKPAGAAKGFRPKLTLPAAATRAASASGLTSWRFLSGELYLEPMGEKPRVVWSIALADTSKGTSPDDAAKSAIVDALTGEATVTE